jgi:hypothetical protein
MKMKIVLAAALAAAAGGVLADDLPMPPNDRDSARQERMDAAYQDHLRQQQGHSSMESSKPGPASRFEDAAKRDAHKTGHAIKTGAHKTAEAIKSGAHKTGEAIKHGVHKLEGKPDAASAPAT